MPDTNKRTVSLDYVDAPINEVLNTYKDFAKVELVMASDIQNIHGITLHTAAVSPEVAQHLIEQTLLKQAGIVITRLDDKRVSVTYNDYLKYQPEVVPIQIASSDIPYAEQFKMRQGDAFVFHLPEGKTIAVWCERPPSMMMLAEQTTASGLKTAWGERPFVRPEPLEKQIGPNSYESAGWKSYISQGAVTTSTGTMTSEYVLYVDDLQFSIIEDLKATNSLPVTIRIIKK